MCQGNRGGASYRGLVAGSQRAAGIFSVDDPGAGERALQARRLIITEVPIDALSAYAIHCGAGDRTPARIISTDGAGPVPHEAIRQTLEAGGRVLVATDNDRAGERLYERIKEVHPEVERYRPALNDDLRDPERAQDVRAERAQAAAVERARAAREAAGQADPAERRRLERLGP